MVEDQKPNGGSASHGGGASLYDAGLRTLSSALIERFVLARAMGLTHGGKRDVYGVLGYDDTVTPAQYRDRYARGGIAKRIINAMPMAVWRGDGEVVETDDPENQTAFEQAWWQLNDQLKVWSTLQRAHILASLGGFSAILLGAAGDFTTPLPRGKPGGLLYLRPIGGGVVSSTSSQRGQVPVTDSDIQVKDWVEDVKDARFGLPLSYQLKNPNLSQNFNTTMLTKSVHWTRIVHVPAPGFVDDEVFGPPGLEAVWNYLLDLDKVSGGGAEAFWLRANAGTQIDVDKKMALAMANDPASVEAELADLREQAEAYAHQMTRMIRTRGVNINQLGSDVADFSGPQDAVLTLIAGTSGIPKRILTGSEMGELASGQDRDNWNDQVNDVRTSYAHPIVLRPFIERLITYGYLPKPVEWQPRWPQQGAMSDKEKIDGAKVLISLNDHGERVVTGDEVREF
ncbi:MAG: anti-CBASS protein Acb1 family protein, partial [Candidatus Binataceae bacterium]